MCSLLFLPVSTCILPFFGLARRILSDIGSSEALGAFVRIIYDPDNVYNRISDCE